MRLNFKIASVFLTILYTACSQKPSHCPDILQYEPRNAELNRWHAVITLSTSEQLRGIWLRITLDRPAELLGNVFGDATTNDNREFLIRSQNYVLEADTTTSVRFFVKFNAATTIPSVVEINLNGRTICKSPKDIEPTRLNINTNSFGNTITTKPPHPNSSKKHQTLPTQDYNNRPTAEGTVTNAEFEDYINTRSTILNKPVRPESSNAGPSNHLRPSITTEEPGDYIITRQDSRKGANNSGSGSNLRGTSDNIKTRPDPSRNNLRPSGSDSNRKVLVTTEDYGNSRSDSRKGTNNRPGNELRPSGSGSNQRGAISTENYNNKRPDVRRGSNDGPTTNLRPPGSNLDQREIFTTEDYINTRLSNTVRSDSRGSSRNRPTTARPAPSENRDDLINPRPGSSNMRPSSDSNQRVRSTTEEPEDYINTRPDSRKGVPTTDFGQSESGSNQRGTEDYVNKRFNSPVRPTSFNNRVTTESYNPNPFYTEEPDAYTRNRPKGRPDYTNSEGTGLSSMESEDSDEFFAGDFSAVINRPPSKHSTKLSGNHNRLTCGTVATQPKPLISYGQNTSPGQWPWHAALYHSKGIQLMYTCGGTLISTRHIVTAAHCVTKPHTNRPINPQNLLVYLGKYNLLKFGSEIQDKEVENIYINPEYNHTVYFNDIAILTLGEKVEVTNYVRPVCLWDDVSDLNEIEGDLGTVVGWGFDQNRQLSTNLMQSKMPIVSTVTCIYSNREFFSQFTSEKTFCAGFRNGTSVCNGDSGGGMVFPKRGTSSTNPIWQIRGIVSVGVALQGQGVCDPSQYIVFTDVAKHLDWVQEILTTHP